MLLHTILELAASERPDALAVIFEDRRLSFAELRRRVDAMRDIIRSLTEPGDRVFLVSDNHLDVVVALYAVPAEGAILTFGNTRSTPPELLQLVESTTPTVVLASPAQLDGIAAPLREWSARMGRAPGIASIGGPHASAERDLTALLDRAADGGPGDTSAPTSPPVVEVDAAIDRDESAGAWLIHTSGTTGRPKGVLLTHRSLVAGAVNSAIARPFADDDVYLFPFPLFHVAAYNVLHAHLRRRCVVLVARFDAAAVLELIEQERVTVCSLAPTMVAMLLDHPDRAPEQMKGLRQISYGASAMPIALLRRTLAELPDCGLAQGYGMTELSGNAVFLSPEMHRRAAADAPHLLSAAGTPGPMVALRIAADDGGELAAGEVGEILVRGDQVCAGYWNDDEATADSRIGPWLRTGDIGRIDADGLLYVIDRKKDIIITGGENVASREVEDVMGEHPAIAQVAVVGIPDDHWGEKVCAVIVAAAEPLDTDDILDWSRGRLAGFKRPRVVLVVDALPVNASGKVDKRLVREHAQTDLHLES